jgi:hypothetical protein
LDVVVEVEELGLAKTEHTKEGARNSEGLSLKEVVEERCSDLEAEVQEEFDLVGINLTESS